MDWMHCNSCFTLPQNESKLHFFLTSCGHLFCEDCVTKAKGICQVCKKSCQSIKLTPPLKQDIAIYFTESTDMLQNHVQEISKTLAFQKSHRLRLISYYAEKCKYLTQNLGMMQKKLIEQEKEIATLRNQNANLQQKMEELLRRISSHNETSFLPAPTAMSVVAFPGRLSGSGSDATTPHHDRNQTPQVGSRLSIRTPPSHGRLGTIPGSSNSSDSRHDVGSFLNRINRNPSTVEETNKRVFQRHPEAPPPSSAKTINAAEFMTPVNRNYNSSVTSSRYSPIGLRKQYHTMFSKFRNGGKC